MDIKIKEQIKGAIFDVDGTILNSMYIWENAGNRYLQTIGLQSDAELAQRVLTMSVPEGACYVKEYYHLKQSCEEIIEGIMKTVEDFYFFEAPLKDGIKIVLKNLKNCGIRMVIATSGEKELVKAAFDRLDILKYFEKIFTCSEVGKNKTSPLIYYRASEYLGEIPQNILVFEDAVHALRTASKAGFHTVGIFDEYSLNMQKEVKKAAEIYVKKWNEFCIE